MSRETDQTPLYEPFRSLTSRTVVLAEDNIDTDQIIPARFLTTTERAGLGKLAFHDWRYDESGGKRSDCVLNYVNPQTHQILVGGRNFGCGSSREHAPWALTDFGFRAVISSEIADIFTSNALKNGLLPVEIDAESHRWLLDHPDADVTIDLAALTVTFAGGRTASFQVESFARACLMQGMDQLGFIQSNMDAIEAYEKSRAA